MILEFLNSNSIKENLAEDMLDKYSNYVNEHKENVLKAYTWLKGHCPDILSDINIDELEKLLNDHDSSKFSEAEFEPYAQKWFGNGQKTPEYEQAWIHHYENNQHHPEYWKGEDIPNIYIIEMLCDWMSFSIKKNDLSELFSFYNEKAKNDPEKQLSKTTQEQIEQYLTIIAKAIS